MIIWIKGDILMTSISTHEAGSEKRPHDERQGFDLILVEPLEAAEIQRSVQAFQNQLGELSGLVPEIAGSFDALVPSGERLIGRLGIMAELFSDVAHTTLF
jgi:hypothetical protein